MSDWIQKIIQQEVSKNPQDFEQILCECIRKINNNPTQTARKNKAWLKQKINRELIKYKERKNFEPNYWGRPATICEEKVIKKGVRYFEKHQKLDEGLANKIPDIEFGTRRWKYYVTKIKQKIKNKIKHIKTTNNNKKSNKSANNKSKTPRKMPKNSRKKKLKNNKRQNNKKTKRTKQPRIIEKCQVCGGVHDAPLHPTFRCSECGKIAHDCCDPVIKHALPKDNFSNINKKDLVKIRKRVIKKLQKNYVCCGCLDGKETKLKNECEDIDGKIIHSIHVKWNKGKDITITEKCTDGTEKCTNYPTRNPNSKVKIRRVENKKWKPDETFMQKSKKEYLRRGGTYTDEDKHDPKMWTYIFVDSGVPCGGNIITGGLADSEKEWMKNKIKYVELRKNEDDLPEFMTIPNAADWGNKRNTSRNGLELYDRLKLYFGYWYTYNKFGNRKYMQLFRCGLKPKECEVFNFLKLRHKALWSNMFNADMLQMNSYHGFRGIAQHFDEVCWFPAPVHSLRIGGSAKLHFGMKGQSATPPAELSELFIEIKDGEFFKMSGIFQILYKHGIPKGRKYIPENTVSILLRKANKYAVDVQIKNSLM